MPKLKNDATTAQKLPVKNFQSSLSRPCSGRRVIRNLGLIELVEREIEQDRALDELRQRAIQRRRDRN